VKSFVYKRKNSKYERSKFIPVHVMKEYRGSRDMLHPFCTSTLAECKRLNSCHGNFTAGRKAVPLNSRLGGSQNGSGLLEKKELLLLPGSETRTIQAVAYSLQ
jgi:hypothetical protein